MSSNLPESKIGSIVSSGIEYKSKIGQFSQKAHLPSLKINVPLALSGSDVFEVFSLISKAKSF